MTDRQTKILEIVNQKKKVEVATLSQMLEVSQVTIRKDLDALEELNFLTREHGYATMKNMSDISNRMAFCYETKQRIAEKASEIISDGAYTVFARTAAPSLSGWTASGNIKGYGYKGAWKSINCTCAYFAIVSIAS